MPELRGSRKSALAAAALSAALYAAACCLPALEFSRNGQNPQAFTGLQLLYAGPLAALVGNFAWAANAVFASSLAALMVRRWGTAAALAAVGVGLGLMTLQLLDKEVAIGIAEIERMKLIRLLPGFYCWMASMFAAFGLGVWGLRQPAS